MKKQKDRLVELLEESSKRVGEYIDSKHIIPSAEEVHSLRADHLLDNGVIVPPCKVGQTVWVLGSEYFWEAQIARIDNFIWKDKKETIIYFVYSGESELNIIDSRLIGKEMFFSKAEAEYALKVRRSVSLVNGHIEE